LLTPEAVPDDGLLDVCLVRSAKLHRILRLLPKTFSGGHVGEPEVRMGRVRRLTLRATTPIPAHADGEVLTAGATAMEVEVLPGALRALAPNIRRP
jgi:diacylglycerol kinase (ATP)